jgi:ascorbate-specific PTS system EIIC-type component UlaA
MADEEKKGIPQAVKTVLKVILGIILLAAGAWLVWFWWGDVLAIIRGFLGIVVILAGIIFLAIAKE